MRETPDPVDHPLIDRLARLTHDLTGTPTGTPVVLSHRTDELVVRFGAVVAKAHARGTDRAALAARLAATVPDVVLPPLGSGDLDGRPVTVWPAGTPLRPDQASTAPWPAAGALLARLHTAPLPTGLPVMGGPRRVHRAVVRLGQHRAAAGPRARIIRAAYATLPAWTRSGPDAPAPGPRPGHDALTHGDFHLGQLVRLGSGWRLIDVDDLGYGCPAWDLARPAAWLAAGVLPPPDWDDFLAGYRAAGGIAVPATGDPWPALDLPARAVAVQIAALAVVNDDLDIAEAFVACCRRIIATPPASCGAAPPVRTLSKLLRI